MPSPSKYSWNEVAGRYRGANGQFVSFERIRSFLDQALDRNEARVASLASKLRNRQITLAEWQIEMRDTIKDIHLASSALARGGWAQMSEVDYAKVAEKIEFQLKKLNDFALQIEKGLPLDGRFARRTTLYAQSGRVTYHESLRNEMALRGFTLEKSVLASSDHCSECVSEAAKGFVPIGDLVLIGERICRSNCRCHVEFSEG
jgi:predicted unusual protein kinase regulating ubiquinone biosynthesis (AarF/ABC1/UbiB family)